METEGSGATSHEARVALRELADARLRLAERVTSPWWYRLGAASCTASLFVGTGLVVGRPQAGSGTESASTLLVALGAVLAPLGLLWALRRSTGVSVERYDVGLGAWYVIVFGLFLSGLGLQAFAGVHYALPVAGVGAFVATVVTEARIDDLLRRRVRAGHDVQVEA